MRLKTLDYMSCFSVWDGLIFQTSRICTFGCHQKGGSASSSKSANTQTTTNNNLTSTPVTTTANSYDTSNTTSSTSTSLSNVGNTTTNTSTALSNVGNTATTTNTNESIGNSTNYGEIDEEGYSASDVNTLLATVTSGFSSIQAQQATGGTGTHQMNGPSSGQAPSGHSYVPIIVAAGGALLLVMFL
ncbi:MAG TPA: hypothetical protein VKJ65_12385, partial [Phycisphaerae bacterium]|nr:hypothetical protein [Phycisphaerae bacterium]